MSLLAFFVEQYRTLPKPAPESCSGKVYIVTGSNSGLGLETAHYLARCSAARIILAVRNLAAGEKAKAEIERAAGRKNVIEVWELNLSSFSSVQDFAKRASTQLERIDGLVENAGALLDKWDVTEGMETSITINVTATMLLAALMMPKLSESAKRFGIKPRLVFLGTYLSFTVQKELAKRGTSNVFDGLNDPKRADMDLRYALSKLVAMYAIREFATLFPFEHTGVIVNIAAPGLCKTGFFGNLRTLSKIYVSFLNLVLARTAEQGSRIILHAVMADEDSHGKFLSGCQIKEHWVPDWMKNADGQHEQRQIWRELAAKLEAVQPGCVSATPKLS